MGHMSDNLVAEDLYRKAEAQSGYFTADQALEAGMSRTTLSHHARPRGRFERVATGLYRLRHFPASRNEHIMAAWLPLRHTGAVVSHASALELHELSDVIPTEVHLSLPRKRRGQRRRPGVRLHTVGSFPTADQLRAIDGLPVTSVERTVIDALSSGEQPEQIEMAIHQALERGLTTPRRLRLAAEATSRKVRRSMEAALARDPA